MSAAKEFGKNLSFGDLLGKNSSSKLDASRNYGNVHVLVEDYVRDENKRVVAVQGINLKTGEEVTIGLASRELFAKMFMNQTEDLSVRLEAAGKMLARRPPLSEFGASRGNKAVPTGGVLSIDEVRKDYQSGKLYGRWPAGLVHIPEEEAPLLGSFEVRKFVGTDPATKERYESAYIQHVRPQDAVPVERASREVLDQMLSGQLAGTAAPMRTSVSVAIALGQDVRTYTLRTVMHKEGRDNVPTPGVEAAVSAEQKMPAAVAAAAVAAAARLPFDRIGFSSDIDGGLRDRLRDLYDGIASGAIRASYMPGATFSPSKHTTTSFLGYKTNDAGERVTARTQEANLVGRGYFDAVVGLRHVTRSGDTVEPVVKAIRPDDRLPAKDHPAFVRLDLQAIGERAFERAYGADAVRAAGRDLDAEAETDRRNAPEQAEQDPDQDEEDFFDAPDRGW